MRTFLARLAGARTDERAWRIGAVGEGKVAAQLEKLRAHDPRWRFLHAVPVGQRGSDIDHVAIGPAGVFTLNAKHHPGARIWITDEEFFVNGRWRPYIRNSRHEAARASRLLSRACGFQVRVRALIVPVRPGALTVKRPPVDLDVVRRQRVARWLAHQPHALPTAIIEEIFAHARRSTTWQP
ncbi:nuclease-related domain-containing protein [Georgenia sp. 10Sc9-8]|uniref:Nuclease-related domain-containing protein n=1 Tax=Georgenia halotolerans TaxID=3028317 RepID=A0ABT5TYZ4_9MICO|nr:nuclease-related domain-containing protein [Georgenia halotolerans]